jgi:hypothetical protein
MSGRDSMRHAVRVSTYLQNDTYAVHCIRMQMQFNVFYPGVFR